MDLAKEQPSDSFHADEQAGGQQQGRFNEGGEVLELAVSKRVGLVRGPVRPAHEDIGNKRRYEVEA